MLEHNFWPDLQSVSGRPAHGAKYYAAQLRFEGAFVASIAGIKSKKLGRRVALF
jgi:hypothetical protein